MDEILGMKLVRRDLTTVRGGREMRYLPGAVIRTDHDVDPANTGGCPSRPGDGVCVAHGLNTAQSGGLRAEVMVLVAYRPGDLLGEERVGRHRKVRVRELRVLDEIVDVHRWLRRHGWGADLRGANLGAADLWGANLRAANLGAANFWGADLRAADLRGANLWGANLRSADLTGANLWDADLRAADLTGAVVSVHPSWLPAEWMVNNGRVVRKDGA